jgi:hypothetical protein
MKRANRLAGGILILVLGSLALAYAGDYLYVRYRMSRNQPADPFDVVTIQTTYAVAQKDGRAEIIFGDPEIQKCVHSLFPHFGYTPCWYLKRENGKPVVIGGAILFCQAVREMAGGSGQYWRPAFATATATHSSRRRAPQSAAHCRSSAASQD